MQSTSIGDALFTKTQQRVLGLLYGKPDKSFYTNEIVRCADMGRGTVRRELERLASAGLLVISREGNQLHYQANPDCPIYDELRGIVQKIRGGVNQQTMEAGDVDGKDIIQISGVISVSRRALFDLVKRYHIHRLVLFGSAARGELTPESDIDLMVEYDKGKAPSLWATDELQQAFSVVFGGRKVDIASPAILRNPYRRKSIESDMKVMYEAA